MPPARPAATFSGFPDGPLRATPVPNPFFSELLPAIDDLGELKLTLYAFWALAARPGPVRYLRRSELADDRLLLQALAAGGRPADEALDEALDRAVARGTLLRVAGPDEDYYFVNTARGRAAAKALADGEWVPGGPPQAPVRLELERPNVFRLYEENIGPLTPMIAETLREAEASFPAAWIEEALRIAVENNVRRWRYVEAILESWRDKGRDEREDRPDTEKARRRYVEGEFADFIEH